MEMGFLSWRMRRKMWLEINVFRRKAIVSVHLSCEWTEKHVSSEPTRGWVPVREQVCGPFSGGLRKVARSSGVASWPRPIAVISSNAAGESSPLQPRGKSTQLQGLLLRMGSVCECVEHYSIHTRCMLPQERLNSLNVSIQLLKPSAPAPTCFPRKIIFFHKWKPIHIDSPMFNILH